LKLLGSFNFVRHLSNMKSIHVGWKVVNSIIASESVSTQRTSNYHSGWRQWLTWYKGLKNSSFNILKLFTLRHSRQNVWKQGRNLAIRLSLLYSEKQTEHVLKSSTSSIRDIWLSYSFSALKVINWDDRLTAILLRASTWLAATEVCGQQHHVRNSLLLMNDWVTVHRIRHQRYQYNV
jgi:hypothetical protein